MSRPSRQLVLVIGAGASAGCHSSTIAGINENNSFLPPVASDIFNSRFKQIQSRYTGVDNIAGVIRHELIQSEGRQTLEDVLLSKMNSASKLVANQCREVP